MGAIRQDENSGIAGATNKGLEVATGRYVAFLDHDDLLDDVALEVMTRRAKATNALLLFSDEDKVDDRGRFSDPAFKPEWNYRLLLSANYVCHFVMVDRATLVEAGGLSTAYNGAQDHDMLLRLGEVIPSARIKHVPEVLYHWRISERSTAGGIGAKPYAIDAGKRAVRDHLHRRGIAAEVENIADTTWYQINWPFTQEPKTCIIIPFKDAVDITRECVRRVLNTDYGNLEVILVDNNSVSKETKKFCEEAVQDSRVRVMRIDEPFNFSRLNNLAARQTNADYLVLMNNDLHVRDATWLRTLVNEATADNSVGIVGGKFLYPSGEVQHAGVVTGVGGVACHINGGIGENEPGYGGRALFAQELSAVTAACMLVNRKLFWEVGGLDEQNLKVAFNDVDLCLKVRELGAKVVWTPSFIAIHHESLTRGTDDIDPAKAARFASEAEYMQKRWGDVLTNDPFYSRFFRLDIGRSFGDLVDPGGQLARPIPPPPLRASPWVHG